MLLHKISQRSLYSSHRAGISQRPVTFSLFSCTPDTSNYFGLKKPQKEPNASDCMNVEVARLMRESPGEFEKNVKKSISGEKVEGIQFPDLFALAKSMGY